MQYKSNTVWMVRMQSGSLAGLIKSVLQWMATPRRLLDYRQTVTHLLVINLPYLWRLVSGGVAHMQTPASSTTMVLAEKSAQLL